MIELVMFDIRVMRLFSTLYDRVRDTYMIEFVIFTHAHTHTHAHINWNAHIHTYTPVEASSLVMVLHSL